MALYVQGIQDIIDTAVNIEFNRSKLVAQTISRSGRISTASRNWANPYRFTVTPKPIWKYDEARTILNQISQIDRYTATNIYFGDYAKSQTASVNPVFAGYIVDNILYVTSVTSGAIRVGDIISATGIIPGTQIAATISGYGAGSIFLVTNSQTLGSSGSPVAMTGDTTIQGNPGQDWISNYRGTEDDNGNYATDSYRSYTASGTLMVVQEATGVTADTNDFIVRRDDFIRISGDRYPYQANLSVPVPIAISGVTGTISGTGTLTTITGLSTVTGLSPGQILTESGTNTGSFGGTAYITSINSSTQITIQSETENTAGSITFNGDGKGNANHKVAIPLNRGYLGSGQAANSSLFVAGGAARFYVKVTKLPTYRFINKDLIEFTGDFELVEEIL